MDEAIVTRWNERVAEFDRVYVLGDVAIARRNLVTLGRLRGKLRLVKGNHDIFRLRDYIPYFEEIHGAAVRENLILTHVPIHPDSLARFGANVHGHLHANVVTRTTGWLKKVTVPDPRYLCVSVEHTDYAPINLAEVRRRLLEQGHGPDERDATAGSGGAGSGPS